MTTQVYEIWSEGYLATGMEGRPAPAILHGRIEGETFEDACNHYGQEHPEFARYHHDGTYWGCRLFDNESDARKAFG